MRLSFIDSDLLYRGIHYDNIDYKSVSTYQNSMQILQGYCWPNCIPRSFLYTLLYQSTRSSHILILKSVCRLVEKLVGLVLLAGLLEIYKIVITHTWKCWFSYIYGEGWNSSHIPLAIYCWDICWSSYVDRAPWNI
jgi:hypothetical protein